MYRTADGHEIELLVDGMAFFDALESALARAHHYAWIESYIVAADATGGRVAKALLEAPARRVEVALLCDGFGSFALDPDQGGGRSAPRCLEPSESDLGCTHD